MTARLVVCTTCRFSSEESVDAAGLSGGRRLLQEIQSTVEAQGGCDFRIEEQACLWACSSYCTVYLSEPGKPAYLAGGFVQAPKDAQAIVAFTRLYAGSLKGAVPYRDWPESMKGRFLARLPER